MLCDARWAGQARPQWFDAAQWGDAATPVARGGRGGAWFVDGPFGRAVLRRYLRGGWAAKFSRDGYAWTGEEATRGFAEFRITRALHARGLPVPAPIAAAYWRNGRHYRAAILVARIEGARTLAEAFVEQGDAAPWAAAGALVARMHRAGLEHADLNADNLLFDAGGNPWMIDFDKAALHQHDSGPQWREANLARLSRSLRKQRHGRSEADADAGFARLRDAYARAWENPAP